jgi:hypothetical protein
MATALPNVLQMRVNSCLGDMVDNLLGYGSVGLLDDSVDALGCLNGIRLLVDPFEFFKGTALSLDTGG